MPYRRQSNSLLKQRGAALLMALFIVAVLASVATLMAIRQQINIRITELMLNNDRLYLYAQGAEDWAIQMILQGAIRRTPSSVPDVFPPLRPVKFGDAVVAGMIQDQQGLFNLNSLTDASNLTGFVRLLNTVDVKFSQNPAQATAIALAINKWLTPGSNNADEFYGKLTPPYRAAHHPMASISELRLVEGITSKLFLELAPYVSALPTTKNIINVSTAPLPVLMALAPMSLDQARGILECRQSTQGFVSTDVFNTCLERLKLSLNSNQQITVQSNYFLSVGQVIIGKQQLILYSLLYRSIKDKQVNVTVLWESRNTI